ncbi:hypothetical protein [Vibrio atypicus]|jgi:hypothetical protein|uniref:hypothetical protein n=1 Tax=Vibrio atypicus TaxID=558271 RepID=UPI001358EB78|nr:hypothetical protein [Vibrio atypicus]
MKQLYPMVAIGLSSLTMAAHACTYDGQFRNPFSESYPGALDVAIATYEALDNHEIKTISTLEGTQGLRRASWWLQVLTEKHSNKIKPVSYVYLIDSHLWSQIDEEKRIAVHSAPVSDASHSVILLSEAALSALIHEQVSFEQAIDLGIVQFSG